MGYIGISMAKYNSSLPIRRKLCWLFRQSTIFDKHVFKLLLCNEYKKIRSHFHGPLWTQICFKYILKSSCCCYVKVQSRSRSCYLSFRIQCLYSRHDEYLKPVPALLRPLELWEDEVRIGPQGVLRARSYRP